MADRYDVVEKHVRESRLVRMHAGGHLVQRQGFVAQRVKVVSNPRYLLPAGSGDADSG